MSDPSEFQTLEQVSRRSLRMYDLTKRERLICEVIIDFSFAKERESAVIPEMEAFVDLTGLDKADVSRALQLLLARGIVQRSGPVEARVYAFIPAAAYWNERKPLFDVERAIARAVELERINEMAPAFDRRGQKLLPLPAAEPGLDEGMAMAAREEAIALSSIESENFAKVIETSQIGESPISQIGESPTLPCVGKSPTGSPCTRARDVTKNVTSVTLRNVTKRRQFADGEKNYVFEQLEHLARSKPNWQSDFERYRGKWIQRVGEFPNVVLRAVGDAKLYVQNHRLDKSVGALIYSRCKVIAKELGKDFTLW